MGPGAPIRVVCIHPPSKLPWQVARALESRWGTVCRCDSPAHLGHLGISLGAFENQRGCGQGGQGTGRAQGRCYRGPTSLSLRPPLPGHWGGLRFQE